MKSDYKAIQGLGSGWGQLQLGVRTRLYQAGDHLLLVMNSGYTEEYKRVFFRDIRYVVARQSHGQTILVCVWAVGLLASLLFFLYGHWGVGSVLAFICAIALAVNILRGATCRTYINTDVQTLELPVPRRFTHLPVLIAFLNGKVAPQPTPTPAAVPSAP